MAVLVAALMSMLMLSAAPAGAITDGEPDGDGHPQVALILMRVDANTAYRCSGTLIAPTYVLTAGHCTSNFPGPDFESITVFFGDDLTDGLGANLDNAVEAVDWAAHPLYETASFVFNDVGMIELAEPVELPDGVEFPTIVGVDALDTLAKKRGRQETTFKAVGYGLQRINPVFVEAELLRMVAFPKLNQINAPGFTGDFSLLLSNNHSTGGTCFGDSGGPNFWGDTLEIAGVTSFGINGNCAGTGGVFRLDRLNVQEFIYGYMGEQVPT